MLSAIIYT